MEEIKRLQQLAGILTEIRINKPINLSPGQEYYIKFNSGNWYLGQFIEIDPLIKSAIFKTELGNYSIFKDEFASKIKNK